MYDLEKSDVILCNTKASNLYKHKSENDRAFLQRMGRTNPDDLRNVGLEHGLFKSVDPRLYTCTPAIDSRGGNAVFCEKASFCDGYKCYTQYHLNDYLVTPCPTNTWRNHVECDEDKCCSVHHQMYDNHTRRR